MLPFLEAHDIPLEQVGCWYLTTILYMRKQNEDTADCGKPDPMSAEYSTI